MFIERFLVQDAALSVIRDHHRPETAWCNLLFKMTRDVDAHLRHSIRSLNQNAEFGGGLGHLVSLEVIEAAGQLMERLVDGLAIKVELDQPRLEVELFRGAVSDRL